MPCQRVANDFSRGLPLGQPPVFPGHTSGRCYSFPRRVWLRILAAAGIADLHLHDLRRTLGSYMAIAGAPMGTIGAALGHRDAKSTAIYARLTTGAVGEAMARAVGAMRGE